MISEVVMPQMGADMTEGTIVRWLKGEGDQVERGEIIAEIETDKANVEIEAFESGVFRKVLAGEGDTVDVGTPIAVIAAPEDDISQYDGHATAMSAGPAAKPVAPTPPPSSAVETPPAGAKDRAPAPAPTQTPIAAVGRVRVSPVAKKLAQERGIDPSTLEGSGPDGRVVLRDVKAATAAPSGHPAAATTTPVAMSKMRQTIARRMTLSKQQAPHYYITLDVDVAAAEGIRHQINDLQREGLHVSVNDMLVKATALALQQHPAFNSWYVDGVVQQHSTINVCVAVALDDGLIAPAILDCAGKSLLEISASARDLAQRTREGSLKADEYTAGTFTISNLGPFNVEALIAIIQPPQTAILGVGSVIDAPVIKGGQIVASKVIKVALSADHRVTDGAQGARFLNEIRTRLERPAGLLLEA